MPEIQENISETIIVTIEAMTTEGKGIARIPAPGDEKTKGYTVFCDGLLPGEKAEVRITDRKKNYAEAKTVKLISASPSRTTPFCAAFETCGGCCLQHLKYEDQLLLKREHVVSCLSRIGRQPQEYIEAITRPTLGMDHPYDYRNHMQYPVSETVIRVDAPVAEPANPTDSAPAADAATVAVSDAVPAVTPAPAASVDATIDDVPVVIPALAPRDLTIGLYGKRSHTVVHHNSCRIAHPACETVRRETYKYMLERGITGYDAQTGLGTIRHLIVRVGYQTGDLMVIFVTNTPPGEKLPFAVADYVKEINYRLEKDRKKLTRATEPDSRRPSYAPAVTEDQIWKLKSVWQNHNTTAERQGQTLSYRPENTQLLHGSQVITDRIGENKYIISPLSFFQVNPRQTEKLYDTVLEYALGKPASESPEPIANLVDIYCGAGTIGLHLSRYAQKIIGIESSESAVKDARQNATLNKVTHATYHTAHAETLTPSNFADAPSCIILDPPRKGCVPTLLNTVLALKAPRLIYVSCDPATLGRDIEILVAGGYKVMAVQPVDMFPWTEHVETVVGMERDDVDLQLSLKHFN